MGAYNSQPAAVEAMMAVWGHPVVRGCLQDRGYVVEDDATDSEINMDIYEDGMSNMDNPDFVMCLPPG